MSTATSETPANSWSARSVAVAVGEGPAVVATDDSYRRTLTVVNIGTVPVYLTPIAAEDPNNAFLLPVGGGYEYNQASPVYAFLDPAEVTDGLLNTLTQTGER